MVAGLPAADEEWAMLFAIAATYLPTLALTDQAPSPFGSQTMPIRGLSALSLATRFPALSTPWFRSYRSPRLSVRWLFQRRLSLTKNPLVRKLVPRLPVVM